MRSIQSVIAMLAAMVLVFGLSGCGYNRLQTQDEQVIAAWSEVVNQYQRRADLVDNLVKVTQEYADREAQIFTDIAKARSQVGSVQISSDMINNPEALQKFEEAQGQLGGALSRLLAVSERYPDLKASALFQDLNASLEGTENRIAVARKRYIESVQAYNGTVRTFPSNLTAKVFGMERKANFAVANEAEIASAPQVNFGE